MAPGGGASSRQHPLRPASVLTSEGRLISDRSLVGPEPPPPPPPPRGPPPPCCCQRVVVWWWGSGEGQQVGAVKTRAPSRLPPRGAAADDRVPMIAQRARSARRGSRSRRISLAFACSCPHSMQANAPASCPRGPGRARGRPGGARRGPGRREGRAAAASWAARRRRGAWRASFLLLLYAVCAGVCLTLIDVCECFECFEDSWRVRALYTRRKERVKGAQPLDDVISVHSAPQQPLCCSPCRARATNSN